MGGCGGVGGAGRVVGLAGSERDDACVRQTSWTSFQTTHERSSRRCSGWAASAFSSWCLAVVVGSEGASGGVFEWVGDCWLRWMDGRRTEVYNTEQYTNYPTGTVAQALPCNSLLGGTEGPCSADRRGNQRQSGGSAAELIGSTKDGFLLDCSLWQCPQQSHGTQLADGGMMRALAREWIDGLVLKCFSKLETCTGAANQRSPNPIFTASASPLLSPPASTPPSSPIAIAIVSSPLLYFSVRAWLARFATPPTVCDSPNTLWPPWSPRRSLLL